MLWARIDLNALFVQQVFKYPLKLTAIIILYIFGHRKLPKPICKIVRNNSSCLIMARVECDVLAEVIFDVEDILIATVGLVGEVYQVYLYLLQNSERDN